MPRGEQLGRYRVLELIGQGGMGTVHLGEHELLRHHVAIKILHDRHTRDPAMERRFYNEARAIAALEHPGIVKLFDIGRASDGRAYLVMELLRGHTLRQRIGTRGVARPHLVPFAVQIASALGAAHERGIVHRDVKPENVFIVSDPDVATGERVKILDFGVAKRTELSATPSPEITRAGMLLGTPAYMAPEHCRGDDEIDARADIYAFGVLLYEMVAGTLPFTSTNTEEVLSKQLYCAPPPLPASPGVPAGIVDVVARCLAKAPGDRFPTMAQVGAALLALESTAESGPGIEDDDDGEFPDLDTLPLLGRMEDATTGVLIAVEPPARPKVSRRRVLLAIASAAAIVVALSVARGGSADGEHAIGGELAAPAPMTRAV
ncbi:MAG TPA: serine/threonine-protein kinase, partial [Kofleriaceae bacterium]|nr:serine/threonine-protein kinase [Kofleriaceae bacterium]